MKKFLLFSLLTIIFSFGVQHNNEAIAQEECSVTSASFSEITGWTSSNRFEGNFTNLTISTSGDCSAGLSINLKKVDDRGKHLPAVINKMPAKLVPGPISKKIIAKFKLYEDTCYGYNNESTRGLNWGYDCVTYIEITHKDKVIFSPKNVTGFNADYIRDTKDSIVEMRNQGILLGNCTLDCAYGTQDEKGAHNWIFWGTFDGNGSIGDSNALQSKCKITDEDVSFSGMKNRVITNASPVLKINTKDCIGVKLSVSLMEGSGYIDIEINDDVTRTTIDVIPKDEVVTFLYEAGNEECNILGNPDCQIYLYIQYNGNVYSNEELLTGHIYKYAESETYSSYLDDGILLGDCAYVAPTNQFNFVSNCLAGKSDWTLKGVDGVETSATGSPAQEVAITQKFDRNHPCHNGKSGDEEAYLRDCYELLAPIPGISSTYTDGSGSTRSTGFEVTEDGRQFVKNIGQLQIGDYINTLVRIALGVLIVLSIIMIIIAGVEYMVQESMFGKSAAKSRIANALSGLIVGLSIYLILSTINPQLLEVNFSPPVQELLVIGDGGVEPVDLPSFDIPGNSLCSSFTTINQPGAIRAKKFSVCSTIAPKINNLLKDAKADGIILSAYGARETKKQIELRVKNCGGTAQVYNPKATCKPPTALPGQSMHESGLALDFICVDGNKEGTVNVHEGNTNGTKKEWTRGCYEWIKKNASKYGLKGLKSENWHWSTTGR